MLFSYKYENVWVEIRFLLCFCVSRDRIATCTIMRNRLLKIDVTSITINVNVILLYLQKAHLERLENIVQNSTK